ncbi:hypothetical protein [Tsukamurella spumae]|uniref:Uncharacterized protein n=1 Tax=Tsukamurella spumae TaxID=44753 RepID=A0A846X5U7_9ACTN|nr:hypothetical protein [Tsukamurella spumae]NKY20878.1 hypothetical protein [Tsukamurella spumae]
MSEYEYVDEAGNPVDPSTMGDDVEIVEYVDDEVGVESDEIGFEPDDVVPDVEPGYTEPVRQSVSAADPADLGHVVVDDVPPHPATPRPALADATALVDDQVVMGAKLNSKGKFVIIGAGVAALAVVGGLAFGLHSIGNRNTVEDIKAGAASKYAQASQSVVAKSSEARNEITDTTIDACSGGLAAAMATGSSTPKLTLDVLSAAPLPGGFIAATAPNADGQQGKISMLQLTRNTWGVYTTVPLTRAEKKAETQRPGFWKADVVTDGDQIRVTGDRVWAGGDTGGAGSCAPGEPGVYAATGKVPADAAGLVDGQASVTAIQGIAGEPSKAVAVMGNSVALVHLVEAEPEGGDASASSSAVPSK